MPSSPLESISPHCYIITVLVLILEQYPIDGRVYMFWSYSANVRKVLLYVYALPFSSPQK